MTDFRPKNLFFNHLIDHGDYIEKVSTNAIKIREEFNFLSTVPDEINSYYPKVFNFVEGKESSSYSIVKIPVPDASHLLVSNDYQVDKIHSLLDGICEYLDKIPSVQTSLPDYQKSILRNVYVRNLSMVREATTIPQIDKLNEMCAEFGYKDIHQYCDILNQDLRDSFLKVKSKRLYYSHGDLRFANILPTSKEIFFIDPKGYLGDIINTYRTMYHDVAQLSASLLGRFDLINHELFEIDSSGLKFSQNWEGHDKVVKKFHQMLKDFGMDVDLVRKLEASLFLSLIPLHKESEKKVLGLMLNSLKIFKES